MSAGKGNTASTSLNVNWKLRQLRGIPRTIPALPDGDDNDMLRRFRRNHHEECFSSSHLRSPPTGCASV